MKQYVATFFSHFGAIRFQHRCVDMGWPAQLAPVPRSLSSSCGTCVLFSTEELGELSALVTPELEQLAVSEADSYQFLYTAEE